MNILLIDQDRCGLDFALRCAQAGHSVRWYRKTVRPVKDGVGFPRIQIVNGWREHMKWAKEGLILTTANCSLLKELDAFREFGFPIFAPSFKSAQMEIDRGAGMKLLAVPYTSRAPEVEALVRIANAGLHLEEVPVTMEARASGESKLRGSKAVKLVVTVAGTLLAARLVRSRR